MVRGMVPLLKFARERLDGGMVYVDAPLRYPRAEYERVERALATRLIEAPGAIAVYGFGGVEAPGISDMDVAIVFEDDAPGVAWPYDGVLGAEGRYMLMHGVFAMPRWVFERRQCLIPMSGLRLIEGREVGAVEVLDGPEREALLKLYAAEYLLQNIASLGMVFLGGSIKMRWALCALHGLRHDFAIFAAGASGASGASDGAPTPREIGFTGRVEAMRRQWLVGVEIPGPEVGGLALEAVECCIEALARFGRTIGCGRAMDASGPLMHFGPGFYLAPSGGEGVSVDISTGRIAEATLGLVRGRGGLVAAQIRALAQAFEPGFVHVPAGLFSAIAGRAGGAMGQAHARRREVLERYEAFMHRCGRGYGMFDIFRWRAWGNPKWWALSGLSGIVARRRVRIG